MYKNHDKDAELEKLNGFRADWQRMIDANQATLERLVNSGLSHIPEIERAIERERAALGNL